MQEERKIKKIVARVLRLIETTAKADPFEQLVSINEACENRKISRDFFESEVPMLKVELTIEELRRLRRWLKALLKEELNNPKGEIISLEMAYKKLIAWEMLSGKLEAISSKNSFVVAAKQLVKKELVHSECSEEISAVIKFCRDADKAWRKHKL